MADISISQARPLRRPRRIDWRAIMGIFLLLVAVVGSLSFWSASTDTRPVLVAARDLPAGETLDASDLAIARVRVNDSIYQAAVPAEEMASVVGKQLAEPAHAHQLLVHAQVSSQPLFGSNELAFTIAISPENAVGGQLQPGDDVQILLTTNTDTPEAHTEVVLPRATVLDIGHDPNLTVVNTDRPDQGSVSWLTLIVTPDEALQLGRAKWAGELDVALLPPRGE